VRSRRELDDVACQLSIELFGFILQSKRLAPCTFCNNIVPYISRFKPLNAGLNPICHLLAIFGAHLILHVSRIRFKGGANVTELATATKITSAICNQTVRDFLERAEMRINGLIIKTGNGLVVRFQPFRNMWR
jgi:hypothetical protein